MWMTSCTRKWAGRILGILQKVSWDLPRWKKVDVRSLAEALWQVSHVVWGRWKISIERWYLPPYVEKPFNSKVIKGFIPELRSRKFFFVFRDSYVNYVIFMDIMNILCPFHKRGYLFRTACLGDERRERKHKATREKRNKKKKPKTRETKCGNPPRKMKRKSGRKTVDRRPPEKKKGKRRETAQLQEKKKKRHEKKINK